MKLTLIPLILIPALLNAESDENYVNFIRQIQQDNGVEWDVDVAPNGETLSPTGVSADGAFFELWSIHSDTAAEYLLDEQFVTSYTPNAVITILTADPYGPVARTRIDQPFVVLVTVTGLIEGGDETVPDAAKQVDYSHSTFVYEEGSHSLEDGEAANGTLIEEGYMEVNGTATIIFGSGNLTGDNLTQIEGEEHFTVSAEADFGVSASVLDSKKIQIWPIARATLSGFDPDSYYEDVPSLSVSLFDLYPSSATFVRIYPGATQAQPTNATIVPESYVLISDSIPQNRTLTLKNLDRLFNNEGLHTVEVLHETPFGADLLASSSIKVDRTIELNGGAFTSE